jgi:hypothetical protein
MCAPGLLVRMAHLAGHTARSSVSDAKHGHSHPLGRALFFARGRVGYLRRKIAALSEIGHRFMKNWQKTVIF